MIAYRQLRELGYSPRAIRHRVARGRLHATPFRGVYAVGRPELTRRGVIMAAVLRCGPHAAASHDTAAELAVIRRMRPGPIEITVPVSCDPRPPGVRVHRRRLRPGDLTHDGPIPLTSPVRTLLDLAARLPEHQLEAAVNEADKLDLVGPEELRTALERYRGSPGVARLRQLLDRDTFRLTDSELERRFLRLVRDAGLPTPETQAVVCGLRVDFYWPALGLVVETDGLRYHRTPAQQANDRHRDQTLTAAGLTVLRFSHADVHRRPRRVTEVLAATAR